ncbi:MAG TPA: c-type cytochrome [Thermoleophilaceae bacterium]|nr:c-type cytochrome [Thermoleophilaceae bacterium]
MSLARNTATSLVVALVVAAAVLSLAACGRDEADLSNGKALFVEQCGSCHVLGRAGTAGPTGPDLDAAFRSALADGMDRETVEGIVHRQILNPRKSSVMPAELVTGDDARDVAAYVGFAAARMGEDEGALAQAGLAGATTGEQIFTAAGCAGCHTLAKANATGNIGPSLDELAAAAGEQDGSPEDYVNESLLDPDAVVADGFQPGVMPSYEGRLNDEQLQALTEYLLEGG